MVYIIDTSMLITGIVVLIIGIILYVAARYAPGEGGISKILSFGGIILALIGVVLIILAILLPLINAAFILGAPIILGG